MLRQRTFPFCMPVFRNFCWPLRRVFIAIFSLSAFIPAVASAASHRITMEPVEISRQFPLAAAPGALQYACASDAANLERFFYAQSVPFRRSLVQKRKGLSCHIYYRPTIPGFRAHAESDPVTQLVFGVESRSFLAGRAQMLGDSLDVAKAIAKSAPGSVCLTVTTRMELSEDWNQKAIQRHFPERLCKVSTIPHRALRDNVWAQDYVLSGEANGRNVALLPWMTFENTAENAEKLTPVLDAFESKSWIRSKLSWEGGDFLVAQHPRNPGKSILFYGDAAKPYWAESLSKEEYAHVLQVELGADEAISAGGIATHIDYVLNFLPDGTTVLLAKPLHGDLALGYSALDLLMQAYPGQPLLMEASQQYLQFHEGNAEAREKALTLLGQAAEVVASWPRPVDLVTSQQAELYTRQHCAANPQDCFSGERFERLLVNEPKLATAWIQAMADMRLLDLASKALIGIAASQLVAPDEGVERSLNKLKRRLRDKGFQVIEVPHVDGMPGTTVAWAGISYTNFIAVQDQIFMPVFGLGQAENQLLSRMQAQLPAPFRIVPVFSRHILSSNGGVHCVTGVLRTRGTGEGQMELSPRTSIQRPRPEEAATLPTEERE
jgi:hypothetical protein